MPLQPAPQSIEAAADRHAAIRESVLSHRGTVLDQFRRGDVPPDARFFAMTLDEVSDHFDAELAEADASAVVAIVAATEAAIRDDYHERITGGFKDPLSKAYAAFHGALSPKAKLRPPFDETGIVDEMRASGLFTGHKVTNFRRALRLRHWYAHGRYWLFRQESSPIAPPDVYQFARALLDELPASPKRS